MRYGIGMRRYSVDEISERLGVMPRKVERIELRAFRKLREASVTEEILEKPAPDPLHGGGYRPPLPAEAPQLPEGAEVNPWDEV